MRDLAIATLAYYELNEPKVAFYRSETNRFYRVTTATGEHFILRLALPGWRSFEDLLSEAMWLNALAREGDISAPTMLPTRAGEYVLPVCLPGTTETSYATLMSWVPGRLLGNYLTERNLEKMGALTAKLHRHGAAWLPPAGFTTRRFEHWLSRGEENLIISSDHLVESPVTLPGHAQDLLERMHRQVELAYAAIDRSDLRVIHCDLWHNNIKLHRGILHPLDFEDTIWGFRAHDIAMAMLDLLEATGDVRYPILLRAYRRGYARLLAWPENPIEPYQIGRLLWKINWIAGHEPQWLMRMIDRYIPVFECYEQTGQVVLLPAG